MNATTPTPPYWAVIFTSRRTDQDESGYQQMAARMEALAAQQPGYLGMEHARSDRDGITVSYWEDEASIAAWKQNLEHLVAQQKGRDKWYQSFALRVCRVERQTIVGTATSSTSAVHPK